MKGKKGNLMQQAVIHIILVGIIFAIFLMAIAGQVNGRDVKQQVLEKEIALLIDSAEPGFSFDVSKINVNGLVSRIEIKESRVFVTVDGFGSVDGYSYFSRHRVSVEELNDVFRIKIE